MTAPYTPGPTPTAAPEPRPRGRLDFWIRGPGIMILIVVGGLLIMGAYALLSPGKAQPTAGELQVKVVSCTSAGSTATIGVSVTNNGTSRRSVALAVEYRDANGARLDTDTAYVRDIAPGDTARAEETTMLDAAAESVTCSVTGIR